MRKIVEVQYFIDEKRSRTEDDYPVKGDFSVISMGSLTHGPFYTLDDVTAKLKELGFALKKEQNGIKIKSKTTSSCQQSILQNCSEKKN